MKTLDEVMQVADEYAVYGRGEDRDRLRAAIESHAAEKVRAAVSEERERTIWDVYRAVKRAAVVKGEDGRFRSDVNPSAFVRIKGAIRALSREYGARGREAKP